MPCDLESRAGGYKWRQLKAGSSLAYLASTDLYFILQYTPLCCNTPTVLQYTPLCCNTFHYTMIHSTTLQYTPLHCNTLHYTTLLNCTSLLRLDTYHCCDTNGSESQSFFCTCITLHCTSYILLQARLYSTKRGRQTIYCGFYKYKLM